MFRLETCSTCSPDLVYKQICLFFQILSQIRRGNQGGTKPTTTFSNGFFKVYRQERRVRPHFQTFEMYGQIIIML